MTKRVGETLIDLMMELACAASAATGGLILARTTSWSRWLSIPLGMVLGFGVFMLLLGGVAFVAHRHQNGPKQP